MKKIVLIGDSIRQGYCKHVKTAFENVAEVYYPPENCRFTTYILRHVSDWQQELGWGDDVDCVHWNAGLWDSLIMQDGEHLVPLEIYKYYINRVCKQIKYLFPTAKVIFATSTPVVEELFTGICKRYNKDVELYNEAAIEIAKRYDFAINDLYAITKDVPKEYHSDLTHFYTKEGTRLITDQVISCLEECTKLKAEPLNYDELFAEVESVEGF